MSNYAQDSKRDENFDFPPDMVRSVAKALWDHEHEPEERVTAEDIVKYETMASKALEASGIRATEAANYWLSFGINEWAAKCEALEGKR